MVVFMLADRSFYPFFSVIVPVYNNESYLEHCISSILFQSCDDFELILVNDGSTDRSSQICDEFASKDSRIRVIHRKNNGGVVVARNEGLANAFGKYVVHVDGDDWISKKLLERAKQTLYQNDEPDIYIFSYIKIQDNGKYIKKNLEVREGLYNKERLRREIYPNMICRVGKKIRSGIDSGSLWNKIIKRELLERHYCRDLSLFRGEDSVCAWECMYFAEKIFFSNLNLYFYNCANHDSSINKYHADLYENNKAVVNYLRTYLNEEKDIQIERQINVLEYRGIMGAIHQEIRFRHSIHDSARLLAQKSRDKKVIYYVEGLPKNIRPYIWLLNLKCFGVLLAITVLEYCVKGSVRFAKSILDKVMEYR